MDLTQRWTLNLLKQKWACLLIPFHTKSWCYYMLIKELFISCLSNRWCMAINKMLPSSCLKTEYICKDNTVFFTIHEKNFKKTINLPFSFLYHVNYLWNIISKSTYHLSFLVRRSAFKATYVPQRCSLFCSGTSCFPSQSHFLSCLCFLTQGEAWHMGEGGGTESKRKTRTLSQSVLLPCQTSPIPDS